MIEEEARNQQQGCGNDQRAGDLVVQKRARGQRCLHEYFKPEVQETYNGVMRLPTNITELELRSSLINMMQNSLFNRLFNEDPVAHVENFLEKCDTVHITEVTKGVIKMQLFPFSLSGKAKSWF
ncbi:hypothetical protein Scep_009802 [Stephania cephalantha]|uniref:Uncharacterized protein n=1 Tax=Stephania cephalantha TaxID=152367 RepID=A0AAP0JTT4_9MAGN